MITREEAVQILESNGINFDQLSLTSIALNASGGTEMNWGPLNTIIVGYLSAYSDDGAFAVRFQYWDYSQQAFVTTNFLGAGPLNISNFFGLWNGVTSFGGGQGSCTLNGWLAKMQ